MTSQNIQSRDIELSELFQGFYSVPDYQREYVWGSEQVEQLLTDIHTEFSGANSEKTPEYFIGSIVVCKGPDKIFELIDGQQRMTTLFLTFCAIRDRFKSLELKSPEALSSRISAVSEDSDGLDVFRYRLDLQYQDSGNVLEVIAKGEDINTVEGQTRSIGNIANAYTAATSFLSEQFGENGDELRKFYGYFVNKVKLIRIETEEVAKALKIFETINDRGVGLDSMDLLKNLLFMKSKREDFDSLKSVWKDIQDTIHNAREKPLRFLRYFIFSRYTVDVLREDEIYSWFSKNEEACGFSTNPTEFAQELLSAAQAYSNYMRGCDASGTERTGLLSLKLLGGSAARQHLILLLAGRHLPEELFTKLVAEVENLFFVYIACRENTRDFERNFAKWAPELRQVENETDLEAFLLDHIEKSKSALSTRFEESFRRLSSADLQMYRLRYILAKLNQHLEISAYGETESTKWLRNYIANEFEVEHIHPRKPNDAAVEEFGVVTDPSMVERIGNLVLVEKPINASLGNKPFSIKSQVYPKSNMLLVKCISVRPSIGKNTKVDRAVSYIEPFTEWNEGAIATRQQGLYELAKKVWNIPATDKGRG